MDLPEPLPDMADPPLDEPSAMPPQISEQLESRPAGADRHLMIDRRALPGFAAGLAGLICSVAGLLTERLWLVGAAGACAMVAGLFTLGMADRLRRTSAVADDERARAGLLAQQTDAMAARAARFEAEAILARSNLADARRLAGIDLASDQKITDPETGLFNEEFFVVTMKKRLSAARRGLRPLAVVLVDVAGPVVAGGGRPPNAKAVADALLETLRDADTACRLDNRQFALILEDTPENGAVWTIERVRRRLADQREGQTLWAGVACYPAHAFDAVQILEAAMQALAHAKDWQQDRIEVALVPED